MKSLKTENDKIMSENKSKKQVVNELRIEYAVEQKKGMPFIMASFVVWMLMLIAFLTNFDIAIKNIIAMCCSALLMPLGMLFGKLLKVNTISNTNPLSGLAIFVSINQVLYLPIVLWAMYAIPDKMIMIYAIIVGAHFLAFYWLYFSPTYFYASIIIPIASLILGIYFNQVIVCLAFVLFDILICLLLCLENKQARKYLEEINEQEQSGN